MKKSLIIILALLLVGSLGFPTGCGGKKKAKPATGPAAEKKAAAAAESPEIISEPVVSYEYHSEGKRDPFFPFVAMEEEENKKATPLERFDLFQLRVNGILAGSASDSRAMIGAPDGQVYIVRLGTLVGRHSGKVIEINRGCIVVEEKFKDFYGKAQERKSNLCFVEGKKLDNENFHKYIVGGGTKEENYEFKGSGLVGGGGDRRVLFRPRGGKPGEKELG